jgi:hypothetical protein
MEKQLFADNLVLIQTQTDPTVPSLGIEHLKPLVDFLGNTVSAISQADRNGDGKISFMEAVGIVPNIALRLFNIFRHLQQSGAELRDLNAVEVQQLVDTFGNALQLPVPYDDLLIHDWLRWLSAVVTLVERTKARKVAA